MKKCWTSLRTSFSSKNFQSTFNVKFLGKKIHQGDASILGEKIKNKICNPSEQDISSMEYQATTLIKTLFIGIDNSFNSTKTKIEKE